MFIERTKYGICIEEAKYENGRDVNIKINIEEEARSWTKTLQR